MSAGIVRDNVLGWLYNPGNFSLVDDAQYVTDRIVTLPSVFSQLDAAFPDSESGSPPNWKVYFHDYSISTMITPYVYSKGKSKDNLDTNTITTTDPQIAFAWTGQNDYSPNTTSWISQYTNKLDAGTIALVTITPTSGAPIIAKGTADIDGQ